MNYNPVHHDSNKHVEIADHYAREQVAAGTIEITRVDTKDNLADLMTKMLSRAQFWKLVNALIKKL